MFEKMMEIMAKNLKKDIAYYLKHNIKSPNLSKIQNEFKQDNEDFKESCMKLRTFVQEA